VSSSVLAEPRQTRLSSAAPLPPATTDRPATPFRLRITAQHRPQQCNMEELRQRTVSICLETPLRRRCLDNRIGPGTRPPQATKFPRAYYIRLCNQKIQASEELVDSPWGHRRSNLGVCLASNLKPTLPETWGCLCLGLRILPRLLLSPPLLSKEDLWATKFH
jgi:hypothetical protein